MSMLHKNAVFVKLLLIASICMTHSQAGADEPEAKTASLQGAGAILQCQASAVDVDVFAIGTRLFSDRDYTLVDAPEWLLGKPFFRGSIEGSRFGVSQAGVLTILIPEEAHP